MRVVLAVVGVLVVAGAAKGQERSADQAAERIRATLQTTTPTLKTPPLPWSGDPGVKQFGIVTLLPPDTNGQFVRASIPVGDLTMRVGRAVAAANRRRVERDARESVQRALRDFLAQR